MIQRWDSPILIDDEHNLAPCRTHHGRDLDRLLTCKYHLQVGLQLYLRPSSFCAWVCFESHQWPNKPTHKKIPHIALAYLLFCFVTPYSKATPLKSALVRELRVHSQSSGLRLQYSVTSLFAVHSLLGEIKYPFRRFHIMFNISMPSFVAFRIQAYSHTIFVTPAISTFWTVFVLHTILTI